MRIRNSLTILCCLLMLVLAAACFGRPGAGPSPDGAETEHVWVYGESALVAAVSPGRLHLRGSGPAGTYALTAGSGSLVDQGLLLWQLQPGEYYLFWDEQPLLAGEVFLPEGYTLPRQGRRLHWVFEKDRQGLLTLRVEHSSELPEGWYDVIVDAGHGGKDTGAKGSGYIEAELNLENARDLAERLRELGLSVALTRDSADVPGGAAAEADPYARGARVELIYASHAPYLLSCHLNASEVGQAAGFQVYCSVAASPKWAQAVADALRAAGAEENNGGKGLLAQGVYQRPTENVARVRDHYFILRETGGYALSPANYLARHREARHSLAVGAQGLLLEFAFMDNEDDLRRWLDQRELWLAATARGCAEYWQL